MSLRNILSAMTLAASLALICGNALAADATLDQVYQAARAGNYGAAQSMMDQVLRDHPDSAKAHFVEAELLARQGRLANAQSELATAERLKPGLPFANAGAVSELRARLASPQSGGVQGGMINRGAPSGSHSPWGVLLLVVGVVALLVAIVRMMSQRSAYAVQGAGSPGFGGNAVPGQAYGGGGMGMGPMAPPAGGGMGSGILGGLATGAAVGAGMVAGEALMHRVLDGGHRSDDNYLPSDNSGNNAGAPYDMGGSDFGISDGSSWDDGSSGGGGDDWS